MNIQNKNLNLIIETLNHKNSTLNVTLKELQNDVNSQLSHITQNLIL